MRSSDGAARADAGLEVDGVVRRSRAGWPSSAWPRAAPPRMMLTNRYEAPVVDLATLHLGAVPLSLYNSAATSQLTYLLDDAGVRRAWSPRPRSPTRPARRSTGPRASRSWS